MEERRDGLRPHAAAAALTLAAALAAPAAACELPAGKRLESARIALSYRTAPAQIAVGEHFVLEFRVCRPENLRAATPIKVDAHMPEHRHGMNYRPSVTPLGTGRYRSEGWLFHMPGRWEFVFEVGGERLTDSVTIE
jgi:hypothetical protein